MTDKSKDMVPELPPEKPRMATGEEMSRSRWAEVLGILELGKPSKNASMNEIEEYKNAQKEWKKATEEQKSDARRTLYGTGKARGGLIEKNKKVKMMGGGMYKKPQMMYGGMYKGKQHSYAAGGKVKEI